MLPKEAKPVWEEHMCLYANKDQLTTIATCGY